MIIHAATAATPAAEATPAHAAAGREGDRAALAGERVEAGLRGAAVVRGVEDVDGVGPGAVDGVDLAGPVATVDAFYRDVDVVAVCVKAPFHHEIARAALEAKYHHIGSPFRTAEQFGILDIIDPRETRSLLCDWAEDARAVLEHDRSGPRQRGR